MDVVTVSVWRHHRRMFPLPLTIFEEFMLAEDRPGYPCVFYVRLRFQGALDRAAWERAIRGALKRHPLLAATVRRNKQNGWEWAGVTDQLDLTWTDSPTESAMGDPLPHSGFLDLCQVPGLRIRATCSPHTTDVVFQVHHTACDGQAIFFVLHDVLVLYANEVSAANPEYRLSAVDVGRLRERGKYGRTWSEWLKMMPRQFLSSHGPWRLLIKKPVGVIPHVARKSGAATPSNFPMTRQRCLDRDLANRLREVAKRRGVTVNDFLLRDYFLTLNEFRSWVGTGGEDDRFRLMVPVTTRLDWHQEIPAANIASSVFLDRSRRDCSDSELLLQSIHKEMEWIKQRDLRYSFLLFLKILRRVLPGGLARAFAGEHCKITSVLTNLGRPMGRSPLPKREGKLVVGNVLLDAIEGFTPLRPYMCATMAVGYYGHRLTLNMHYDPDALTLEQGDHLLERFVQRVEDSARQDFH